MIYQIGLVFVLDIWNYLVGEGGEGHVWKSDVSTTLVGQKNCRKITQSTLVGTYLENVLFHSSCTAVNRCNTLLNLYFKSEQLILIHVQYRETKVFRCCDSAGTDELLYSFKSFNLSHQKTFLIISFVLINGVLTL